METLGNANIVRGEPISLPQQIEKLLPEIGSVKIRRDTADYEHAIHAHETDEVLLIINGNITFYLNDTSSSCSSGDMLILPKGTKHSSIAGSHGCVYVIALT